MGFEEMNVTSDFVIPRFEAAFSKSGRFARDGQCLCLIDAKQLRIAYKEVA